MTVVRAMRNACRIARLTLISMAMIAATAVGSANGDEAKIVHVDPVRAEPTRQTVSVIGRLVACRFGDVAARVGGPVAEIRVRVGDRVAAGDVLAVVDRDRVAATRDLRAAEVAEAEARLAAVAAERTLHQQELARLSNLRKSPAFNEGRFQDKRQEVMMADSELAKAEAELASARAQLRLAELDHRDTHVLAPYEGAISQRKAEIGAHVDRGAPVVTLVDDRCLEIEADVPSVRIAGLETGAVVSFELEGRVQDAKVRAVVPEENPMTQTRRVRFVPELSDTRNLAANQSVTLMLPVGRERDVVSVHKDAILSSKGKQIVFVVVDGVAQVRPLELGNSIGNRIEVLKGLVAGDTVVVRGNERLRPGEAVRIQATPIK